MAPILQTITMQDWPVDVKPAEKFPVPTFIRLFITNRVLRKHIDDTRQKDVESVIRQLVTLLDTTNEQNTAFLILSNLIDNDIQKYIEIEPKYSKHAHLIEKIFNKIILSKFCQEYQYVITYKSAQIETQNKLNNNNCSSNKHKSDELVHDDNYNDFESMVFNTNDLMSSVLQFLKYSNDYTKGDLFNCSLVCSHWLYHVWNPNSIYFLDVDHLFTISNSKSESEINDHYIASKWQRFINIKKMRFDLQDDDDDDDDDGCVYKVSDLLLTRILTFGNIEQLNFCGDAKHIPILNTIMSQCEDKILKFDVDAYVDDMANINKLSPLKIKLLNARYIRIANHNFNIIWSTRCQTLQLSCLNNICPKYCQFIIDNCDCSGIRYLNMHNIQFSSQSSYLLSKLGQKFSNIKKLRLSWFSKYETNFQLFWQGLDSSICKNNGKVELITIDLARDKTSSESLFEYVRNGNVTVTDLSLSLKICNNNILAFKKLIENNKKLEHLRLHRRYIDKHNDKRNDLLKQIFTYLNSEHNNSNNSNNSNDSNDSNDSNINIDDDGKKMDIVLPLLHTIALDVQVSISNLDLTNDFLKLNMIGQRGLSVICKIYIEPKTDLPLDFEKEFLKQFEIFCQNVYSLMIEQEIFIDIVLSILWNDKNVHQHCDHQMHLIYNKIISHQYKKSKSNCNQSWTSTDINIPIMSLEFKNYDYFDTTLVHVKKMNKR